jgi:hypothetical protein
MRPVSAQLIDFPKISPIFLSILRPLNRARMFNIEPFDGGAYRIRTCDPHNAIVVTYIVNKG